MKTTVLIQVLAPLCRSISKQVLQQLDNFQSGKKHFTASYFNLIPQDCGTTCNLMKHVFACLPYVKCTHRKATWKCLLRIELKSKA